jgi:hypothetical protein
MGRTDGCSGGWGDGAASGVEHRALYRALPAFAARMPRSPGGTCRTRLQITSGTPCDSAKPTSHPTRSFPAKPLSFLFCLCGFPVAFRPHRSFTPDSFVICLFFSRLSSCIWQQVRSLLSLFLLSAACLFRIFQSMRTTTSTRTSRPRLPSTTGGSGPIMFTSNRQTTGGCHFTLFSSTGS